MRKKTKSLISVVVLVLIYVILKIYVINTPTPHDDAIPDIYQHILLADKDY